jgi:hypothetical protein
MSELGLNGNYCCKTGCFAWEEKKILEIKQIVKCCFFKT